MTRTYNEGLEAAAKLAERFMGQPNDCDQLGSMDMETGVSECYLELRGYDCPCQIKDEAASDIAKKIRALKQEEAPEPVYKSVERILNEHSAWISRPSDDVTRAVALAATIAAFHALEKPDSRDALIKELMGALEHAQNNIGWPDQLIDEALSKAREVMGDG